MRAILPGSRALLLLALLALSAAAEARLISGVVFGNGTPLGGAVIELLLAADGSSIAVATTGSDGGYSVAAADGTYDLLVTPPAGSGFDAARVNGIQVAGADVTQNVALVTGATTLSGTVRLPDGTPVSGVNVIAYNAANGTSAIERTAADGTYALTVATGTYRLGLSASGAQMSLPGSPSTLSGNNLVTGLAVGGPTTQDLLLPLTSLSGLVTDSAGSPVAEASPEVSGNGTDADGASWSLRHYNGNIRSGADGRYRMLVIDGLSYSATAHPPPDSGLAQTDHSGIHIAGATTRDFALAPATSLSGIVALPDGTPVVGVNVYARRQGDTVLVDVATTDATGRYSLAVGADTYRLDVFGTSAGMTLPGSPNSLSASRLARDVTVSGATVRNLTLPLVPLSGTTTGGGAALGGVGLDLTGSGSDAGGASYVVRHSAGNTLSGTDGAYRMLVVDGLSYRITATPPADSGFANTGFGDIAVAGATSRDLALAPAQTLSGTVALHSGEPLAGITVYARRQADGSVADFATTASDGGYTLEVAADTYRLDVYAGSNALTLPGSPSYLSGAFLAQDLTVSAPTTRDLSLPLVALSGSATDSNGVAIPEVSIASSGSGTGTNGSSWSAQHYANRIRSDTTGRYRMTLVDGLDYRFTITAPAGSGFAESIIDGLNISGDSALGVVLQLPDTTAPRIISGPLVTNIGADAATVVWQTDEPALGAANWGSGSTTGTLYQTSHALALEGLMPETPYSVNVAATDAVGNGPTTASVAFTTAATPDSVAPLIVAGPTVAGLTHTSATLEWETDEPATSAVGGDLSAALAGLRTVHRVELAGLDPLTTYQVLVASMDQAGNGPSEQALSFTTLNAPDLTPPVITKGPWLSDVTAAGATITWETDEAAVSGVSYNDGVAYGVLSDDTLTRVHSVALVGLSADTAYTLTASSTDAFGNGPTLSSPLGFRTAAAADTSPPVLIEPPAVCDRTEQRLDICLRTDEPTSVVVEYGTAPNALTRSQAQARLMSRRTLSLTGLAPATRYYMRVTVQDQAGNARTAALLVAQTLPAPPGPPVFIDGPTLSYLGDERVVIAWETDRPAAALVEYIADGATRRIEDARLLAAHSLVVPNLTPGSSYDLAVRVTGADGQAQVSLVTASVPDTAGPVVTAGPTVHALPGGLVEIRWQTDEAADSRVSFGTDPAALTGVAGDLDHRLEHAVRLGGLVAGATYFFQLTSVDPVGNATTGVVASFVAPVPTFTLSVITAGDGDGSLDGGGIFPQDTLVSPNATAAAGSRFDGWTPAACAAPFALTADTTCVATFSAATADLDGDGSIGRADFNQLRAALGACAGEARFNAGADYDGDGCVSNRDYRTWYRLYRDHAAGG